MTRGGHWLWIASCMVATVLGCKKPENQLELPESEVKHPRLPEVTFAYAGHPYPSSWLDNSAMSLFRVNDSSNPITDEGATLGRVLFYDEQLSIDASTSCASCHQPEHGFADAQPYSEGVGDGLTFRNSMALVNLAYQRRLFWDARESNLEDQVLQPIAHTDEMGMDLEALPMRLEELGYYGGLFHDAFGDSTITVSRVAASLAQFLRSLQSTHSRYDLGLQDDFASFSTQELLGKDLFFNIETRCAQCHGSLNFYTPSELMVNGLDTNYAATGDGGLAHETGISGQDGLFRVVSLRNVGLSAPYMHDGRFSTLREVIDFYADGIQPHPNLNHRLSPDGFGPNGQTPLQMELTDEERDALVAFLHTLTDTTDFTLSPWGSPF
jgi:cytochrome c peroxidase